MLELLYPRYYVDSLLDIPLDSLKKQNISAFTFCFREYRI